MAFMPTHKGAKIDPIVETLTIITTIRLTDKAGTPLITVGAMTMCKDKWKEEKEYLTLI